MVDRANALLGDPNLAIGPSHFLADKLTPDRVDLVWTNSVLPFIEEQLLHDPGRIEQFELARLRQAARRSPAEVVADQPSGSSDPVESSLDPME